MRTCLLALVLVACTGNGDDDGGDDDGTGTIDAPPGAIDAPPGAIDAPPDAPPGACASMAGTWGITGQCGADTCLITQTGCATDLDCGGGASSYTGSVSGNTFMYAGTAGGGQPATCSGTVDGNTMSGSCTIVGIPCSFTGQRL